MRRTQTDTCDLHDRKMIAKSWSSIQIFPSRRSISLSFGTAWTTEQSELPIRCVPTNVQGIIFRSDQGVWVFVDSYPLPLQPSSGAGTHLVPASCRGRWFPITATRMGSDWLGIPGKNDEGFFSEHFASHQDILSRTHGEIRRGHCVLLNGIDRVERHQHQGRARGGRTGFPMLDSHYLPSNRSSRSAQLNDQDGQRDNQEQVD